ncbi:MAG: hypothetical protein K8T10_07660 [Candidatus Eremiobacteraeota bacterium]|nr:hypothetical protein [Candidatus Eremiobacteraeota bacterium]
MRKNFSVYNTISNNLQVVFYIILSLSFPVIFAFFTSPAHAAPYGPKEKATVFQRMYESDLVIYGKVIQKVKTGEGKNKSGMTEVEVYKVIKGKGWKKGDYFYINSILKYKNKSVGVFYLYKSYEGGKEFFEFNAFYPDKNKQMLKYSEKIKQFMNKKDTAGRIRWLFTKVDSSNKFIAWDAFAQLGQSSYGSLKQAAPYMNRESLRYLISTKGVGENRKSFYAFLLGLGRDPADKAFIKSLVKNPHNKNSQILYGAMMAYGLLYENYPSFYLNTAKRGISDTMNLAILEATLNLMKFRRPSNPSGLLKSYYYFLQNGNKKVTLKALRVARDLKISGPVKYMRSLYLNKYNRDKDVKIAIITYLKFVRKTPSAKRLLKDLKNREWDPGVKKYFTL